jgi:hypothetical protein
MKLQVLIVLLVLLALVLIVGLVLGPTLEKQPGRGASFLNWARERGDGMEKRVRRSELRYSPEACLQNNSNLVLDAGQRCRVDISSADENVRALELELLTPGEVRLSLEHRDPKQGLNVETILETGDPLKVQVYERGAKLVLSDCSSGSDQGCRVRLK